MLKKSTDSKLTGFINLQSAKRLFGELNDAKYIQFVSHNNIFPTLLHENLDEIMRVRGVYSLKEYQILDSSSEISNQYITDYLKHKKECTTKGGKEFNDIRFKIAIEELRVNAKYKDHIKEIDEVFDLISKSEKEPESITFSLISTDDIPPLSLFKLKDIILMLDWKANRNAVINQFITDK